MREMKETKIDALPSALREKVATFTEIVKTGGATSFKLQIMSLVSDAGSLRCSQDIPMETSGRQ